MKVQISSCVTYSIYIAAEIIVDGTGDDQRIYSEKYRFINL
jgi:hypothetical protein